MNLGIMGIGRMGRNHLRVLNSMRSGFGNLAIFDNDAGQLHQTVKIYDVKHYHDIDSFLAAVDAVIISTPTRNHYESAAACIRYGKDILIEKPIASSVEEAESLSGMLAESKQLCMIGHVERFNPVVLYLKEFIKDKKIVSIAADRIGKIEKSRLYDVNVVLDLMIHDIDVVSHLVNSRPAEVCALSGDPVLDSAQAMLKYEDGTVATFNASRVSQEKIRRLEIQTTDEIINIDYIRSRLERVMIYDDSICFHGCSYKAAEKRESIIFEGEPLALELQHFLECVKNRRKPISNEITGSEALKIADKIVNKMNESR